MTVTAITFAGRRDRMHLLLQLITKAIDVAKIIDQWHIWDYSRTPADEAWLKSLDNNSTIRVFTPSTKVRFGDCYKYYTTDNANVKDNDVFIKLDDDIVYFEVDKLASFIQFRKAHAHFFIVSANIINNPLCASIQAAAGVWDNESIPNLKNLHTSAAAAHAMHQLFLDNPACTQTDTLQGIGAIILSPPDHRLNINLVSWMGKDRHVVGNCDDTGEDEIQLCLEIPRLFGRPIAVYWPFVAAHLSFFTQDADMDTAHLLNQYQELLLAQ